MKVPPWQVGAVAVLTLWSVVAFAQTTPPSVYDPFSDPQRAGARGVYDSAGAVAILTVYGEDKHRLDRQALVKLTNKANNEIAWRTTQDNSEALFNNLLVGTYDLEISAVGYLTEHKSLVVGGLFVTYRPEVFLKRDPVAVDLTAREAREMRPKARREMNRAILALRSGDLNQARKRLTAAYNAAPSSPDVNFLLGYFWFAKQNFPEAEKYLVEAVGRDNQNVQALTLLGRVRLLRDDEEGARRPLEQAVAADPEYWLAHSLLGQTYLKLRDYEKARDQAQLAVEKGKGLGNSAQLVLGQALANLGQNKEAVTAFSAFLNGSPASPLAAQVKEMIDEIERRQTNPTAAAKPLAPIPERTLAAQEPVILKSWGPPGVDEARPAVSVGVECPTDKVIEGAGRRVKQLLEDVTRFDAIEDVLHQDIDEAGNPTSNEVRKFNYVAAIGEVQPGVLQVDEYRSSRSDVFDFPRQIATRGPPGLVLVFHPAIRDDYQMQCEGLGQWRGQATWLVHFRQRDDRPSRIHGYNLAGKVHPVSLKGRAWISASTFQIVRTEAELVKPMPEIQLVKEQWAVEYGPVTFPKKKVELWLPKTAELYFDFRHHRYFRRHSFDKFMLFSVESEEKRKTPAGDAPPES